MRLFIILFITLIPAAIFALDINIAPILFVDETENNNRDNTRIQADLLSALNSIETENILRFNRLSDNRINPPQSVMEAVTVCRNEQIEYLVYGFVTKRANNYHAEIRLFEYETRTVIQTFYGMDNANQYERLIQDLAWKILNYIGETFNLDIKPEKIETTRLLVPIMAGYWTPMDPDWTRVMIGTVNIGSGIALIPSDNLFITNGMSFYIATGMDIKYRLGIGNSPGYESYNHTVFFTIPVRIYMNLKEHHQLFFGLGYIYFLEIFLIANKYSDMETNVYNNMGLNITLGYRYQFNNKYALFFRNDFDILFNERVLLTFSPMIGMEIQIYEKQIRRKW